MNYGDEPTDEDFKKIEEWELGFPIYKAATELLEFVKSKWWMMDWCWHEEDGMDDLFADRPIRIYNISTGGWSGNEYLISAMQGNYIFWSLCFYNHRRGGHWTLHVPKE